MIAHGLPVYVALAPVDLRFGYDGLWGTSASGCKPLPVKPRFVVAFETALRPGTLNELSVPEHYTPGSDVLIITDEIDKARFGREMPFDSGGARSVGRGQPKSFLEIRCRDGSFAVLPAPRDVDGFDGHFARLRVGARG